MWQNESISINRRSALLWGHRLNRIPHMIRRRKTLALGIGFFGAVILFMGYHGVFVPLKFRYLIDRVESAQTAAEERRAFELAADWGRVWEVDRLKPNASITNGQSSGGYLVRLEWLESSPYSGGAYVVYRPLIDTNNLKVLYRNY